jgi:peptidyl-prolyl cis-trans isomerase SurA
MKYALTIVAICTLFNVSFSQTGDLIDKVIGVVGNEIVLLSDLEMQALQVNEGIEPDDQRRCMVFEELLFQKLLLTQARFDSIEVGESEIQQTIEQRLQYFYGMLGSKEAFEEYYGKTEAEWREEFHDDIEEQILAERAKASLFSSVSVTPGEVHDFYKSLPSDSLPLINEQLEYSQIIIDPPIPISEQRRTREFLDSIRTDIESGKTTMTLQAAKYSEDPGSKYKGGCYPLQRRGVFVPEYEAAVYNTPEGGYSPIFETVYGYHFVHVKEKRGEFYQACHLLMSAKVGEDDLERARQQVDSLSSLIRADSLQFGAAAIRFSTDEETKNQEGRVINRLSGSTSFEVADIDPNIFFIIENLEPGGVSEPFLTEKANGKKAWAIVKLDNRVPAHKANLKQDYLIFLRQTEAISQQNFLESWVSKKLKETYVRMDDTYSECPYSFQWLKEGVTMDK